MKTAEQAEARKLRLEGRSVKEIARLLGVSSSSVSAWVRDIELTEDQQATLAARTRLHPRLVLAREALARKARTRRMRWQEIGRHRARSCGPLYVAGCMLYWAEGSRSRNKVVFTNSDPEMVGYFVSFLRRSFPLAPERLRVTCNLFADHIERQREIEDFWLRTLELPRSCLCRSTVNHYSRYTTKKRKNKLPYGTCRVVVNSTEIAQTIYGSIQELAGFDRREWLDMAA
jgi:transposase-like protein